MSDERDTATQERVQIEVFFMQTSDGRVSLRVAEGATVADVLKQTEVTFSKGDNLIIGTQNVGLETVVNEGDVLIYTPRIRGG